MVVVRVDLEVQQLLGAAVAAALVGIVVMVVVLIHFLDLLELVAAVAVVQDTQTRTLMTPNAKAEVEVA